MIARPRAPTRPTAGSTLGVTYAPGTLSDMAKLSGSDMRRVAELAARNFGVDEKLMPYKGTMDRVLA